MCAHLSPDLLESPSGETAQVTLRIGDIVIDCHDPRRAADFWCAALGYTATESDETGVAVAGHSSAPTLLFLTSNDRKLHKNRIHFDVCPVDGTTRDDEVKRLESLGAKRIDVGQTAASWVVMADPDGNEFCVMSTACRPSRHRPTISDHRSVRWRGRRSRPAPGEIYPSIVDVPTAGCRRFAPTWAGHRGHVDLLYKP